MILRSTTHSCNSPPLYNDSHEVDIPSHIVHHRHNLENTACVQYRRSSVPCIIDKIQTVGSCFSFFYPQAHKKKQQKIHHKNKLILFIPIKFRFCQYQSGHWTLDIRHYTGHCTCSIMFLLVLSARLELSYLLKCLPPPPQLFFLQHSHSENYSEPSYPENCNRRQHSTHPKPTRIKTILKFSFDF